MPTRINGYIAVDGSIFDTEQEAIEYEKEYIEQSPYSQLKRFFDVNKCCTVKIFDINKLDFVEYSILYVSSKDFCKFTTLLYKTNVLHNADIIYDEYRRSIPKTNYYIWREISKNEIIVYPFRDILQNLSKSVCDMIEGMSI